MSVADTLQSLGVTLPEPTKPIASYTMAVKDGGLLYLSGHVCRQADGSIISGRAGDDISVDTANGLARQVAIDLLATIADHTNLETVQQIVRLTGYVRSADGFGEHSAIINGASDFLVEVFGEVRGRHARSAIGVAELPGGAVLEIEAIVRLA